MIKELSNYVSFILIPFLGFGVKRFLIKKNDYSSLKRTTLIIGLAAFFITEITRSFYRPFIYKNNIFDYYIADTIGNSFGTVTAIFMILTLSGKGNKKDYKLIWIIIIGLIIYESLNLTSHHSFDYKDVLATLIFGGFSFIIYKYLIKTHSNHKKISHENK